MFRRIAWCALLLLVVAPACADQPQVDKDDVLRRGDAVEHVTGNDFQDGQGDIRVDVDDPLAPPPSDAHKWFISVIYSRQQAQREGTTGALTAALRQHPRLRAFVNLDDHKQSWAHFGQYAIEDQSQVWRFSAIRCTAYPTIVIQPPRNNQYGNPGIVVCQQVYDGNPEHLAQTMADAIRRYVTKFQAARRMAAVDPIFSDDAPPATVAGTPIEDAPPALTPALSQRERELEASQCPGPYCPNPNAPPPWDVTPKEPFPNVQPWPNQPVNLPFGPNLPPPDGGGGGGVLGGLLQLLLGGGGGGGSTLGKMFDVALWLLFGSGGAIAIKRYLLPALRAPVPGTPAVPAPPVAVAVPAAPQPVPAAAVVTQLGPMEAYRFEPAAPHPELLSALSKLTAAVDGMQKK